MYLLLYLLSTWMHFSALLSENTNTPVLFSDGWTLLKAGRMSLSLPVSHVAFLQAQPSTLCQVWWKVLPVQTEVSHGLCPQNVPVIVNKSDR